MGFSIRTFMQQLPMFGDRLWRALSGAGAVDLRKTLEIQEKNGNPEAPAPEEPAVSPIAGPTVEQVAPPPAKPAAAPATSPHAEPSGDGHAPSAPDQPGEDDIEIILTRPGFSAGQFPLPHQRAAPGADSIVLQPYVPATPKEILELVLAWDLEGRAMPRRVASQFTPSFATDLGDRADGKAGYQTSTAEWAAHFLVRMYYLFHVKAVEDVPPSAEGVMRLYRFGLSLLIERGFPRRAQITHRLVRRAMESMLRSDSAHWHPILQHEIELLISPRASWLSGIHPGIKLAPWRDDDLNRLARVRAAFTPSVRNKEEARAYGAKIALSGKRIAIYIRSLGLEAPDLAGAIAAEVFWTGMDRSSGEPLSDQEWRAIVGRTLDRWIAASEGQLPIRVSEQLRGQLRAARARIPRGGGGKGGAGSSSPPPPATGSPSFGGGAGSPLRATGNFMAPHSPRQRPPLGTALPWAGLFPLSQGTASPLTPQTPFPVPGLPMTFMPMPIAP